MKRALVVAALLLLTSTTAVAQQVEVQEHTLDNGMTILMVPRWRTA